MNQITVRFTDDLIVESDDLTVRGVASRTYQVDSVVSGFDAGTWTTTATFTIGGAGFFTADNLLIEVDGDAGGVRRREGGQLLDGDHDGIPGGNLLFRLSILPGGASAGGNVSHADLGIIRKALGTTVASRGIWAPFYDAYADLNADGRVNASDLALVRKQLYTYLPLTEAAASSGIVAPEPLRTRPATRTLFSVAPILT